MSLITSDLNHLANLIRQEYLQIVRAKLGASYKLPAKFCTADVWLKAAQLCHRLGADAHKFVTCCFDGCNLPSGPFPNSLCGKVAERWWMEHKAREAAWEASGKAKRGGDGLSDPAETSVAAVKWSIEILLDRCAGAPDFDAKFKEELSNDHIDIPAYVRALLAYPQWMDVVYKYLDDTQWYFSTFPSAAAAMVKQNPLLMDIMALPLYDERYN